MTLITAGLACNAVLGIEEANLCGDGGCNGEGEPSSSGQTLFETPAAAETAPSSAAEGIPTSSSAMAGSSRSPVADCVTPEPGLARDCALCGGVTECDGRCNMAIPTNVGAPCGSCGGSIECDGSCSMPTPPNLGEACGSCGGAIECGGGCSVATPSDYGSALMRDTTDSFSCCFTDEVRSYGPDGRGSSGCYPGYAYGGCTVSKISGGGLATIADEDPGSCTCQVHVQNQGLEGALYDVHIRLTRTCG